MRKPYLNKPSVLKEDEIRRDPFQMFKEWFDLACNCTQILEPNAMCLATATRFVFICRISKTMCLRSTRYIYNHPTRFKALKNPPD